MEKCIVTHSRLLIKQWSFGFIENSPLTRSMKNYFGFIHASSFPLHKGQLFYWSIMTGVDSIKCRCAHSGMTGQAGGFQNPGVCLQVFPSFLPRPLPALLLSPFFARSLTLVPRSLFLHRTEMLATQATTEMDSQVVSFMMAVNNHQRRVENNYWRCRPGWFSLWIQLSLLAFNP